MSTTAAQLEAITDWLRSRPGVFHYRDPLTCWQAAHKACGVECPLSVFQFQIRRIGYAVTPRAGGCVLDLSDFSLVREAAT